MKKRKLICGIVGGILLVLATVMVTQFKVKKSLVTIPGPTLIISGEVTFKGYQKGVIRGGARSKRYPGLPNIASVEIPTPGKYSLKVPANVKGGVYVMAVNLEDKEKVFDDPYIPHGKYGENPLKVSSSGIKGVDIVIAPPLKPLIGPVVIVSGEIIFEDYKKEPIEVYARSYPGDGPPDIAKVEILQPGRYSFKVSANTGEIYVGAVNLEDKTTRYRGILNPKVPVGDYGGNPLKVASKDIGGVDIVLRRLLKPFTGPTVIISGEVTFGDYKKGPITIGVRSKRGPGLPDVALVDIPQPGKYTLQVPANAGDVYVIAGNPEDEERDYESPANPFGEYRENPLKVGSENIEGIDIVMYNPMEPSTCPTVTISGKVIFKNYKEGPISIVTQNRRGPSQPITLVEIPEPGKYTLQVPANAGDVYVMAGNLEDEERGYESPANPFGEYRENPLKVGSEDIKGIDIVMHKPLKPPTGPAVTISGEVIFKNYKEGPISILARSKRGPGPPDIALVEIPKPGKYTLQAPANAGDVYVMAGNLLKKSEDIVGGGYRGNPLKVGSEDIKGIDIVIYAPLKPLTGPTVTISGEVTFKNYKEGPIAISARTSATPIPPVSLIEIPGPGRYSIKVPANAGDIYVGAANFDARAARPERADDAGGAEAWANPVKVGSEDIAGIDIVMYNPMEPFTCPTVTISGEVIFKDYERGPITIVARKHKGCSNPPNIAQIQLHGKPGRYSLKVPANAGEIYVVAANFDPKTAGHEEVAEAPRGEYKGNPLRVGSKDIKGVDIVLINPGGREPFGIR